MSFITQDYIRAHKWFNLSAAQGNERAREYRSTVADHMAPEHIAEAQKLAREWIEEQEEEQEGWWPMWLPDL